MRRLTLITLIILAGCSEDAGPTEQAQSSSSKLEPGQWEMTTEITSANIPGVGAEATKAMATKATTSNCITPEQAEKPGAELFAASQGSCKYDHFYMSRGRLNAAMRCTQPGVSNIVTTTEGTYTATTLEANSEMVTSVAGAGQMRMKAKVSGKRVGACTAEPAKAS